MAKDPINSIKNKLLTMVQRGGTRLVENRAKKIDLSIKTMYANFWTILASKIINSASAPDLEEWTPNWDDLKDSYRNRKKKRGKGFYLYSGSLRNWLRSRRATTSFGKPLVRVIQTGSYKGQTAFVTTTPSGRAQGRTSTGEVISVRKIRDLVPKGIEVDLYPRVKELIADGLDAGSYIKGSKIASHVAYSLDNYKGKKNRNILAPYMLWYLNTQVKKAITRGIR